MTKTAADYELLIWHEVADTTYPEEGTWPAREIKKIIQQAMQQARDEAIEECAALEKKHTIRTKREFALEIRALAKKENV